MLGVVFHSFFDSEVRRFDINSVHIFLSNVFIVALVYFKYGRFVADVRMVLMCVDDNYIDLSATLLL